MADLRVSAVDAAIDMDGAGIANRLADLVDKHGAWDWSDEAEHDPSDRMAVIESSGAYWLVYRGTEDDSADRYASRDEAWDALESRTAA